MQAEHQAKEEEKERWKLLRLEKARKEAAWHAKVEARKAHMEEEMKQMQVERQARNEGGKEGK